MLLGMSYNDFFWSTCLEKIFLKNLVLGCSSSQWSPLNHTHLAILTSVRYIVAVSLACCTDVCKCYVQNLQLVSLAGFKITFGANTSSIHRCFKLYCASMCTYINRWTHVLSNSTVFWISLLNFQSACILCVPILVFCICLCQFL